MPPEFFSLWETENLIILPKEEEEEEEDLIDHQEVYKEKCAALPSCSKYQEELESCTGAV